MRIVGFILIIISSLGIGIFFSEKERVKVGFCREICLFLEHLGGAVLAKNKADDIIFRYCGTKKNRYLRAKSRNELILCMQSYRFDERIDKLLLELTAFLGELGRLPDCNQEYDRCMQMLCESRKVYDKCKLEEENKSGLYNKLGIICGIIICIVLI